MDALPLLLFLFSYNNSNLMKCNSANASNESGSQASTIDTHEQQQQQPFKVFACVLRGREDMSRLEFEPAWKRDFDVPIREFQFEGTVTEKTRPVWSVRGP